MRSKKYLCCGIMMFNLPDDFNGTRADALRLVADYMDETEGKQKMDKDIDMSKPYDEIIEKVKKDFFKLKKHKLKTVGFHIEDECILEVELDLKQLKEIGFGIGVKQGKEIIDITDKLIEIGDKMNENKKDNE